MNKNRAFLLLFFLSLFFLLVFFFINFKFKNYPHTNPNPTTFSQKSILTSQIKLNLEWNNPEPIDKLVQERKLFESGAVNPDSGIKIPVESVEIVLVKTPPNGPITTKWKKNGAEIIAVDSKYHLIGKRLIIQVYIINEPDGLYNPNFRNKAVNTEVIRQIYLATSSPDNPFNLKEVEDKIIEITSTPNTDNFDKLPLLII